MGKISDCDPKEIALKSFFLGPRAENKDLVLKLVTETIQRWAQWRQSMFPEDGRAISPEDQASSEFLSCRTKFETLTQDLLTRFEKEVPKFSPRYVGHMFSEILLPALFGHIVALLHNPNNISGESSRVGIQIEDEAIQALLDMVGFTAAGGAGHFTSGGTVANLEALIRARTRCWVAGSEPVMLVPEHKHYSWIKGCHLLGLPKNAFWPIPLDSSGKMSLLDLQNALDRILLERRSLMIVVSVAGTTELGCIDPISEIQDILDAWSKEHGRFVWHHVDAAYGGFLRTLDLNSSVNLSEENRRSLLAMSRATSITLDPHKLGYVPYASGAFLVRDKVNYKLLSSSNTPYIDFDENLDRGPFTIEGSRSAAGATAMWMTAKTIGLNPQGYGLLLERTLRIRKNLEHKLRGSALSVQIAPDADTNILCFTCARHGERLTQSNQRTLSVFQRFSPRNKGPFIVSKTLLRWQAYRDYLNGWTHTWSAVKDTDEVVLIRMCLMNPFFDSTEMDVGFSDYFVSQLGEALVSAP